MENPISASMDDVPLVEEDEAPVLITPRSRLHFIDHPRYGKVYPIVTYDFSRNYFTPPVMSYFGMGFANTVVLYSAFIN
jgi:hypothetical protein